MVHHIYEFPYELFIRDPNIGDQPQLPAGALYYMQAVHYFEQNV